MTQPSNNVLLEKIDNIIDRLDRMNDHMVKLNGSVAKNSKNIFLVKSVYAVLLPILMAVVGFMANALLNVIR